MGALVQKTCINVWNPTIFFKVFAYYWVWFVLFLFYLIKNVSVLRSAGLTLQWWADFSVICHGRFTPVWWWHAHSAAAPGVCYIYECSIKMMGTSLSTAFRAFPALAYLQTPESLLIVRTVLFALVQFSFYWFLISFINNFDCQISNNFKSIFLLKKASIWKMMN